MRMLRRMLSIWVLVLLGTLPVWGSEMCLKCHPPGAFRGEVLHGPVKEKKCMVCHRPHVSKHRFLLTAETPDLCFQCHSEFRQEMEKASWVHLPAEKGSCHRCHLPHAGPKELLVNTGAKLCLNCHKETKKVTYLYTHVPFEKGQCSSCHNPHYSQDQDLLRDEGPRLCFSCHKKKKALASHGPYAREDMECLGCHHPHGSSRKHLVRDFLHTPYQKKACAECHEKKRMDASLCFGCHQETKGSFLKVHTHYLPSGEKAFCLECHSPHASDNEFLLAGSPEKTCIVCHKEALVQARESLHVHPLRVKGNCLDCHKGHASSFSGMLKGDGNTVCVVCHKTQGKFTHPVGETVKDPRNGQQVTCVTCHDPMGTLFKYELRLSGEASLCLECHKGY